ncbi:hypothetical protein KsCSTR_43290 [Candidatus Kuenenia stuttgartiensis]|uniref:Uncharacterized protein n=1 Tax=Kuenenia stuttgartiensis TaxID=174633 RepID=Q1PX49_KUEST|nr:hypothetical protein KsCSTR_43290 [Candidatus Kuenenia stuttgartiensis]CAJ71805.1 unknown protein [Candidatus Kuenenia stuttgartiensis]
MPFGQRRSIFFEISFSSAQIFSTISHSATFLFGKMGWCACYLPQKLIILPCDFMARENFTKALSVQFCIRHSLYITFRYFLAKKHFGSFELPLLPLLMYNA